MPSTQPNLVPLAFLLPAMMEHLTEPQRIFVARYLANGHDAQDAARLAHPKCKNALVRGLQMLGCKSVRRILDMHFHRNPIESALDDVRRLLKRSLRKNAGSEKLVASLDRISKTLATFGGEKSNGY